MSSLIVVSRGGCVGITGDGQLARMLAQAAQRMGYCPVILATNPNNSACQVTQRFIIGKDYRDERAIDEFIRAVDVATTEWEDVPGDSYQTISREVPTFPNPTCLRIAQDRLTEKRLAQELSIPIPPFTPIQEGSSFEGLFPGRVKTRSGAYDGKGQRLVQSADEVLTALKELGNVPCILEQEVDFLKEVSIIAVRSQDGDICFYPVVENRHKEGILRTTHYLRSMHDDIELKAQEIAERILLRMDYVGVLAIEFFVTNERELLFNEMAPRVHNSGHWTIEGCKTSQFENHIRAICGLSLGSPKPVCKEAKMYNLLGDEIFSERERFFESRAQENPNKSSPCPHSHFHDYRKELRPGRKMGHTTTIF